MRRKVRRSALLAAVISAAVLMSSASAQTKGSESGAVLREAQKDVDAGRYAEAAALLEPLVARDPREQVFALLAVSRLMLGQSGEARAVCARAVALHPASSRLTALEVRVLADTASVQERKAVLEARIGSGSRAIAYRKALGELLMAEDPSSARAGTLLEEAARSGARDAEARYFYGRWACVNKKEELCAAEMAAASALAPQNAELLLQARTLEAMAFERLGRDEEAASAYREAWKAAGKLARPNAQALQRHVDFLLQRSRNEEAEALVDRILAWWPSFQPALLEKARQLSGRMQLLEAAEHAEKALRETGTDVAELRKVHAFLAKTYFAMGETEKARFHQDWVAAHP